MAKRFKVEIANKNDSISISPNAMSTGLFFRFVVKKPFLSDKEKRGLAKKIQAGDIAARNLLVESHIGLMLSLIKKNYGTTNVEPGDLCGYGAEGLILAANTFNPTKGGFSKHAFWTIKGRVSRAIKECEHGGVRLPEDIAGDMAKFLRTLEEMNQTTEGAGINDVAKKLGIGSKKLGFIMSAMAVKRLNRLDKPIFDWQKYSVMDLVADASPSPEEIAIRENLRSNIRRALDKLGAREQFVIKSRFGINDDGAEKTLTEVGKTLGVTKQRTRQIEQSAKNKLREILGIT